MIERCPACDATTIDIFHEPGTVPAHSVLLMSTRDEAVSYPRATLRIAVCTSCGFIFNTEFDPDLNEYSQDCEESQGFSPTFSNWLDDIAKRFVQGHDLTGKSVLEIGCGKGEFLAACVAHGAGHGIGIDPAYLPGRIEDALLERLEFHTELYDASWTHLTADAIAHRHTLEHISPVAEHVRLVRRSAAATDGCQIFFELPETLRVLDDIAFWDLYYEHCSYFTPGSLARLLRREGFSLTDLRLEFDEQYILLEGVLGDGGPSFPLEDDLDRTLSAVEHFSEEYRRRLDRLREKVDQANRPVIWGAGSKGVAFLSTMEATEDDVAFAVDINTRKQGRFMPGTGHEVVAPDRLTDYRPDLVLVMNGIYLDEIGRNLEELGVKAELEAV